VLRVVLKRNGLTLILILLLPNSLLLQAKEDGNTAEGGFKATVWKAIADSYEDPLKKKDRAAESKWTRLKKEYKDIKWLREDVSGFGWDDQNKLVTATDEVWEELEKSKPGLLKWRTTPFPWFDDILAILGEQLSRGKYRSFGPLDPTEFEEPDQSDALDPRLHRSESPANDAPNDDEDNVNTTSPQETAAQKRHRESAAIEDSSSKRQRPSGIGVMKDISEGMKVIAEAVKENSGGIEQVPKDTVDSTVEGQAQLKILEEASLTEEGQLRMIEMLANPAMARSYLVFKNHEGL